MTILERLRAATGPLKVHDANDLAYDAGFHGENYALMVEALRGGVDAVGSALALVERMLPGSGYMITRGRATFYEPMFGVELYHMDLIPDDGEPIPYDWPSESNSLPLAILTALFTALEAKEKKDA